MKKIIFIIKAIGISSLPIFTYYLATGYVGTEKHEFLYYPELLGIFSDSNIIHDYTFNYIMFVSLVCFITMGIRYIDLIGKLSSSYYGDCAGFTSYTVSNITTLIFWYLIINLIRDAVVLENGTLSGIAVAILFILYIFVIISELASNDRNKGAFGLREYLYDYYEKATKYEDKKRSLTNKYKKITL